MDNVLNPGKEGQAWILLWDMASIHASVGTLAAMKATFPRVALCFIQTLRTSYLAALRPGSLPQLQELHPDASERHSCPVRPRRLVRRRRHEQGMAAEWGARAVTDFCEKNHA